MNILGISGSPTAVSRSTWLLQHFLTLLTRDQDELRGLETVKVRDLPAQALLHADTAADGIRAALARVADAEVVVIATPIYKAAYSGVLKTFLDLLPQDGLKGKTVVTLATGGSPAHLLAVEYALKPVLSALGSRDILDTVYATDTQLPKVDATAYSSTEDVDQRLLRAAEGLRQRLAPALQRRRLGQPAANGYALPSGLRFSA